MDRLLFHKDVYMPKACDGLCGTMERGILGSYHLSKHLIDHALDDFDRSHEYILDALTECLSSVKESTSAPFEVELTRWGRIWRITKFCFRVPYGTSQDLAIVVRPSYRYDSDEPYHYTIVTAWLNGRNDHHFTLDASKYATIEDWHNANGRK